MTSSSARLRNVGESVVSSRSAVSLCETSGWSMTSVERGIAGAYRAPMLRADSGGHASEYSFSSASGALVERSFLAFSDQ